MIVALLGGTGFVGSYLVDALVGRGHQPRLLVRPGSEHRVRHREKGTIVSGTVGDRDAVLETLHTCDAAIYNIGILREQRGRGITFEALQREGAVRTVECAMETGTNRFLLMSANGVKADGTEYQRTKFAAEERLRNSPLAHTVFRPSVIFGDPRGHMEFCTQLRDQLIRPPLPAPLFYDGLLPRDAGAFLLSPVYVGDVADAFVGALESADTVGKTFTLCGPRTVTWKGVIETIASACGKRKTAVPVPAFYVKTLATLLERVEMFPVTRDQIVMLMEGNSGDSAALFDLLGIEPTPFNADALGYLRE